MTQLEKLGLEGDALRAAGNRPRLFAALAVAAVVSGSPLEFSGSAGGHGEYGWVAGAPLV